jgi:hypothetical protein
MTAEGLGRLSVSLSVVLLFAYVLYLTFALVTHPALFAGPSAAEEEKAPISVGRLVSVLAGATVAIAWMSEIMVSAIEPTTHEFGLSKVFVGVFVVAILGNAAEHATAISAALKNRMDLSLSIAIGSSVQVALFVAPVLVLASLFVGPAPMDLAFPAGLVLIVFLAVLITGQVAGDGGVRLAEGRAAFSSLSCPRSHFLFLTERPASLMTQCEKQQGGHPYCPSHNGRRTCSALQYCQPQQRRRSRIGKYHRRDLWCPAIIRRSQPHEIAGQRFDTLAMRAQAA